MPKIRINFFKDGGMQVSGRTLTVSGLSPVLSRGRWLDEKGKPSKELVAEAMVVHATNGRNARKRAGERKDGK